MKSLPLWIIAGILTFAVVVFLFVVLSCAGFFLVAGVAEHHRRQEIIRREPWREFVPNNGF